MSTTPIIGAKVDKQAEIVADANGLKDGSEVSVGAARRAQRDALAELEATDESVEAVEAVALPSDRVEPESDDE